MISAVKADQLPRELLLSADPDWSIVQKYLEHAACYAEWVDDQIVGLIVLTSRDAATYEVQNLAVAPSYQHRGIARRLLAFAIQRCRQDKTCQTLWVGTGNSSLRQLALYQHAGFEMQTVLVDYFVDNYPEPIYEDGLQCKSMVRLCIKTN